MEDYNGFAAQTKVRLQTALGNKMGENYSGYHEERSEAVANLRNENYYNLSEIFLLKVIEKRMRDQKNSKP